MRQKPGKKTSTRPVTDERFLWWGGAKFCISIVFRFWRRGGANKVGIMGDVQEAFSQEWLRI